MYAEAERYEVASACNHGRLVRFPLGTAILSVATV